LVSSYSPKGSRIVGWVIGPLFIAIVAGTLTTDLFALYSLLIIPIASYIYVGILYFSKMWGNNKNKQKDNYK
jgi:hypothetical protein